MSATGNCRRRLQRAHLQGHLRPPAIKGKWRTSRLFVIEITELPCRVHGSNYRGRKSPIGPDEGERQQKVRRMERETGIEPVTSSLGSWRSTAELLPLTCKLSRACWLLSISHSRYRSRYGLFLLRSRWRRHHFFHLGAARNNLLCPRRRGLRR
jgi:hypothetical protein